MTSVRLSPSLPVNAVTIWRFGSAVASVSSTKINSISVSSITTIFFPVFLVAAFGRSGWVTGIAGSRMRPRSEQRLHGCAELRKFEWFLDELNRVWSAAFRIQFRKNTGRDCEKTRVGPSGADAFEKFNRVRLRRIEIDDEQN